MFLPQALKQSVSEYKPETGIYIGDLDNGISEELLYISIKELGLNTLKYLKLHRYPFLGISRLFAFAYFENEQQAQRALKVLNHKKILKMPIRVTPIPQQSHDKQANLLFMGFKPDVDLNSVDQFFGKWGDVFSVKFSYDDNKANRGYGWVQFMNVEGASACLQEFEQEKGLTFTDGKGQTHKISVHRFVAKGNPERNDQKVNIYLKNFGNTTDYNFDLSDTDRLKEVLGKDQEKIQTYFSQYGEIKSVFLNVDKNRKTPFAFVSFAENRVAREVVEKFTKNNIDVKDPFGTGQTIYVNWAQLKSDRERKYQGAIFDRYIFIQNLKMDVNEERVKEAFSTYGDIMTCRLDRLNFIFGQIRIGYVVYANATEAKKLTYTLEKLKFDPNKLEEAERIKAIELTGLFEQDWIINHLFKPTWKKIPNQQTPIRSRQPQIPRVNYQQQQLRFPPGVHQMFPANRMSPQQRLPRQHIPGMGAHPMIMGGMGMGLGGPMGLPMGGPMGMGIGMGPIMGGAQMAGMNMGLPMGGFMPVQPPVHMGGFQPAYQRPLQQGVQQQFQQQQQQQQQQQLLQQQQQQLQLNIPYDERPDILELKKDLPAFKKLSDLEQKKKIGVLLVSRISEKKPQMSLADIQRVIGMLIDEQFTVDDCFLLLTDEKELIERLQEAQDVMEEDPEAEEAND